MQNRFEAGKVAVIWPCNSEKQDSHFREAASFATWRVEYEQFDREWGQTTLNLPDNIGQTR